MSDPLEILFVEDSDADAELALRVLQQNKLANRIYRAVDGEDALDFLFCRGPHASRQAAQAPRLILLDLKLPKVDGIEVLRSVKSDARTRSVPVVVMTSSREERDLVESYRLGANSYIQKPVDFDEFREIVKKLGFYWLVINEPPPRRM
jgi:CheY-like chemotaxis protein